MLNSSLVDAPAVQGGLGVAPYGSQPFMIPVAVAGGTGGTIANRPTVVSSVPVPATPQVFLVTPSAQFSAPAHVDLPLPVIGTAPVAGEYHPGDIARFLALGGASQLNAQPVTVKNGVAGATLAVIPAVGLGATAAGAAMVEAQLNATGTAWVLLRAGGV